MKHLSGVYVISMLDIIFITKSMVKIQLILTEEISKRTNLHILKGDYYFSLGYFTVCKLGNQQIVRLFSKISENFAKV